MRKHHVQKITISSSNVLKNAKFAVQTFEKREKFCTLGTSFAESGETTTFAIEKENEKRKNFRLNELNSMLMMDHARPLKHMTLSFPCDFLKRF